MNLSNSLLCLKILALCALIFMLNSCTTIVQSGYEYHLPSMAIDLSKNNLEYQIAQEKKTPVLSNKQLDTFDQFFFTTLESNIKYKGYMLNQKGIIQTYSLKNCLIDIKKSEPLPYLYQGDTFMLHQLTSTFMCQEITDTSKLFYTTYSCWQEFDAIPLKLAYRYGIDSVGYTETAKFWYKENPISNGRSRDIAEKLALKSFDKIDSLNQIYFTKAHPDYAASKYKTHPAGDTVGKTYFKLILVGTIILFITLFSPPQP